MSCKFCGKVFNRSFNLRRHERENCTLKDRSSQEMDFEDNFSTSSIDSESESLIATDNEGESEEQLDPWVPSIEEAKRRSDIVLENVKEILINSGIDKQTARDQAYSNVLPKLQKELESVYMQRLMWMAQLKNRYAQCVHASTLLVVCCITILSIYMIRYNNTVRNIVKICVAVIDIHCIKI